MALFFLVRENVYALAFSTAEMLEDTCKQKSIFPLGYEAQQMLVGVYRLGSLSVLAEAAKHCSSCGCSARDAPASHCAAHLVASPASGSSAGTVLSKLICLQHSNVTVSAGTF